MSSPGIRGFLPPKCCLSKKDDCEFFREDQTLNRRRARPFRTDVSPKRRRCGDAQRVQKRSPEIRGALPPKCWLSKRNTIVSVFCRTELKTDAGQVPLV